jgi:hypothetical protein
MYKLLIAVVLGLAVCTLATAVAVAAEEVKCEGSITKVDAASVTVKTDTESHVLTINDKTKVTLNGSAAKPADLKVGQKVKCTGQKDGTKVICTSIEATSA